MKIAYQSDHALSAPQVEQTTGLPLEVWFADFDARGGPAQGRKPLADYLLKERKLDAWWAVTLAVEYEKARGIVEKDGLVKGYNICVTKTIAASPQRIYDALLETRRWMGDKASADLREGGSFDDGDGHRGAFKRLTPGKLMRFTWGGDGHQAGEEVEIKLTANGAKTSVVLNHTRLPDRAAADGMRAAWAEVLEGIKGRVA